MKIFSHSVNPVSPDRPALSVTYGHRNNFYNQDTFSNKDTYPIVMQTADVLVIC